MSAIKLELADSRIGDNGSYETFASGRYVIIRRESIETVEQGHLPGVAYTVINTANNGHEVVGDYAQIAERCGL